MKISLNWLADFLPNSASDGPVGAERAGAALTNAGLPVESIEKLVDDTVLDVEVTSNRGDCLSHFGIARELSVLLNRPLKEILSKVGESTEPVSNAIGVTIDANDLCPRYIARVIRGVKIRASPAWMCQRLEAVGIHPINNVVDVTNYVMFGMGQPLHAFDLAKVGGGKIIVRRAKQGEFILSIDGRKRELTTDMLVIADAQKPVALAGVMGGQESEVTAGTTDILLEAARFDPLSVRKTARALAMKSDSSYRFERGIDPTLPARASLRAAELILQIAGGVLLAGAVAAGETDPAPRQLSLRLQRVKRILGIELPADEIVKAFTGLGLQPKLKDAHIDVTVPSHRLDITQEIDLVEEAARTLGYDRIPTRPEISIILTPPTKETQTLSAIGDVLVAGGYFESVTFSFVSDAIKGAFGESNIRAEHAVRKADASLRPSLLPGLLESVARNAANGTPDARLFEIGATWGAEKGKVRETRTVAWVGPDIREVRGVLEALLGKLDAGKSLSVEPDARPGFAKGAGGRVVWGGKTIGFIGQIERSVAEKLSLRTAPAAGELELEPLLKGHQHVPRLRELPRFPAVKRDVSFIVPDSLRYEKIESLVNGLKLSNLESVEFVTAYRGKPLETGSKSVTIALVFRAPDATLSGEQVDAAVARAVSAAKDQLSASLRV